MNYIIFDEYILRSIFGPHIFFIWTEVVAVRLKYIIISL